MGKRGPCKTPTAVLKLHGSRRVASRDGEPQPEKNRPRMPNGLRAEAKNAWRTLVPKLEAAGVLTNIDGGALARYCEMFARWWSLVEFLQSNGETYQQWEKNDKGVPLLDDAGEKIERDVKQWPQVNIAGNLEIRLLRIEQQFGMTPSARADLTLRPTGNEKGTQAEKYLG